MTTPGLFSSTPDDLTSKLNQVIADVKNLQISFSEKNIDVSRYTEDPQEFWISNIQAKELQAARFNLLDTINELNVMLLGPRHYLRSFICTHYELAAWSAIQQFGVLHKIPVGGEASYEELAEKCGIEKDILLRLLRAMSSCKIVKESKEKPGVFIHTAVSKEIVDDHTLDVVMERTSELAARDLVELGAFLKENPFPEKTQTVFRHKHGTSVYGYCQQRPEKAQYFADFMEGWKKMDNSMYAVEAYFKTSDASNKRTVVYDVAGGSGHASIALARQNPNLTFVVQDIQEDMFTKNMSSLDAEFAGRIRFEKHDFFTPLRTRETSNVKCYLIRNVLHNFQDDDCINILKTFVPLLRNDPEVRLVLNEIVVPTPASVPGILERFTRQNDISMLESFNTKERTEAELKQLLAKADPNLQVIRVISELVVGLFGIVEVKYVHS